MRSNNGLLKKNRAILSCLLLLATILVVGCNAYDDGPLISLRSKANRLRATNKVISFYEVNGVDSLAGLLKGAQDSIPNWGDGVLKFDYQPNQIENYITNSTGTALLGIFATGDAVEEMSLALLRPFKVCCWDVIRLTKRDLWLRQDRNGDNLELHFRAE